MDTSTRGALRAALTSHYPGVTRTDFGPAAVEAGECDECQAEARLVMTCGPGVGQYLGRRCLQRWGSDAFCPGHAAEAQAAAAWARTLPADIDLIARLWWVATGEVRLPAEQMTTAMSRLGLTAGAQAR